MSNQISVQMFGGFLMSYNGKPLTAEKMHKESQFTRLMMVLLHNAQTGVARDRLEELVIGEREMDEQHSSLRIIIYKAKQKLIKLGLPEDENLIYLEDGVYKFTSNIEIVEDAALFMKYFEKAEAMPEEHNTEALKEKLFSYLEAAYLYKGDFLASFVGETWVAQEAKKYRETFRLCVSHAGELLRKLEEWDVLERLGRFASSVDPFCDWEVFTMEALVETGRFDEASQYYSDVVDIYLHECGIYPSAKLMDVMDRLGNQMYHSFDTLDRIQESLIEEKVIEDGGYFCTFPVFKGIYQMTMRRLERTGQNACLLLCTLVDGKGNQLLDDDKVREYVDRIKISIQSSIRHGDVFTRYGRNQYLILLADARRENCELVQNRINHHFVIGRQTTTIQYHVNSVFSEM